MVGGWQERGWLAEEGKTSHTICGPSLIIISGS